MLGTSAVRHAAAHARARQAERPRQVVIRALSENPALIDFGLVPRALLGLLALLCGNGYIVGINQARPKRLKSAKPLRTNKGVWLGA